MSFFFGQHTCKFTDAILIDPRMSERDIPAGYRGVYNITVLPKYIRVGTRQESSDLLSMLASESWDLEEVRSLLALIVQKYKYGQILTLEKLRRRILWCSSLT